MFIDGVPIDHEVVIETESRPRGGYRFLPAWLQHLLDRWGFHVYEIVNKPVNLLPYVPASGSSVMMLYTYSGNDEGE